MKLSSPSAECGSVDSVSGSLGSLLRSLERPASGYDMAGRVRSDARARLSPNADEAYARAPAMAASMKTGFDPITMQWIDIVVAETRADPIPGEDEYFQIMVRQLQEKLAKM
ncbi:hypothetical protein MRX96_031551 [Rhipicephalus microplus]